MEEDPTVQATFVQLDDLKPQRVRTQRHADGSERSIWDRWFVINRDPEMIALHTTWDPEVIVHRHGHLGHHGVFVLRGGMHAGDRWCGPGTYIDLPLGAAAGPYVAGPEGVELFEFTMGDGRSWDADTGDFARLLAEKGVEPLPNPPIDLPEWLEDRRSDHTALVRPDEG
jgi:hypothetical protein